MRPADLLESFVPAPLALDFLVVHPLHFNASLAEVTAGCAAEKRAKEKEVVFFRVEIFACVGGNNQGLEQLHLYLCTQMVQASKFGRRVASSRDSACYISPPFSLLGEGRGAASAARLPFLLSPFAVKALSPYLCKHFLDFVVCDCISQNHYFRLVF